jgi:D-alanyl-D-alanine dipeptidase
MKGFLLGIFVSLHIASAFTLPEDTRQLIVVTTKGWNDNSGMLRRYEKKADRWVETGEPVKVHLGRNGLGWGIGLHTVPPGARYIKAEGDGRSPAGVFRLKQAFGYAPLKGLRYPYRVYDENDHCVDDIRSRYYNRIVDSRKITPDYRSFEHMKFPKNYYKYGIVVNHNHIDEAGSVPGAGSCIFLHIKSVPTAGCTVMKEEQIVKILRWLDAKKHPLLIQMPQKALEALHPF